MNDRHTSHRWARAQRGAAGIEFAFLFTIFFGVFYAIVSYAFITLLHQGLVQAAAEGARAAVRVDRTAFISDAQFQTAGENMAKAAVLNAIGWMPQSVKTKIGGAGGISFNWTSGSVAINTGNGVQNVSAMTVTVKVTYADYAGSPLLPMLNLPLMGTIPNVPANLVGASTLRVTN
jgi:Flp pilus assembly protein TadG